MLKDGPGATTATERCKHGHCSNGSITLRLGALLPYHRDLMTNLAAALNDTLPSLVKEALARLPMPASRSAEDLETLMQEVSRPTPNCLSPMGQINSLLKALGIGEGFTKFWAEVGGVSRGASWALFSVDPPLVDLGNQLIRELLRPSGLSVGQIRGLPKHAGNPVGAMQDVVTRCREQSSRPGSEALLAHSRLLFADRVEIAQQRLTLLSRAGQGWQRGIAQDLTNSGPDGDFTRLGTVVNGLPGLSHLLSASTEAEAKDMLSWALSRTGYSVESDVSSLLTGEEGWRVMTEGRERWQLALSKAGSSTPWGGQYSIRTQQFRVAAEALQALKELALLIDTVVEGGLCSRVTRLFVQCKGGVGDRCAHPQCDTHPSFGEPGGPRTHCKVHKLVGMEQLVGAKQVLLAAVGWQRRRSLQDPGFLWLRGRPRHPLLGAPASGHGGRQARQVLLAVVGWQRR